MFEKPRYTNTNFEEGNVKNDLDKPVSEIDRIRMLEKFLNENMYPSSDDNDPPFSNERMDLISSENIPFVAYRKNLWISSLIQTRLKMLFLPQLCWECILD